MNDALCGCCDGTEKLTPASVANRPGLTALAYRVGTHAAFLETMRARLASMAVDDPNRELATTPDPIYPLRRLTTRAADDAAIALLDGWATVADVLTFYQERIANEGFLRTAVERRSVLELARLVGYALRPGVASTVYLAYTIDENQQTPVEIPIGTRSQSVPGPGELPQSFETAEVLDARAAWNTLKPRLSQPQTLDAIQKANRLYLKGITTNLKPNDPLLIVDGSTQVFGSVIDVQIDVENDRTAVILKSEPPPAGESGAGDEDALLSVMRGLSVPPSVPPPNTLQLSRAIATSFAPDADGGLQVVNAVRPDFKGTLATALANVQVAESNPLEVVALRLRTGVYGNTAPLKPITDEAGKVIGQQEWPLDGTLTVGVLLNNFDGGPNGAAISVADAGGTSTRAIALQSSQSTSETLGTIKFTFDPTVNFKVGSAFKVTYKDTASASATPTNLIYQLQDTGTIDLTIKIGDRPPSTIRLHGGQISTKVVQSHNFKIAYAAKQQISINAGSPTLTPSMISVSDEAPLPPSPRNVIALDGIYDQIASDGWVVIVRPDAVQKIGRVADARPVAKTDYNFPARVTQLTLNDAVGTSQDWLTDDDLLLSDIRSTTVFAQSARLELAEEPMVDQICGGAEDEIELDGLYSDLKSGRWLIVAGNRGDIKDQKGNVVADLGSAELVMLDGVRHGLHKDAQSQRPGDQTHTFITLAKKLAFCYRRDKATIYGNVVKATHGETRSELLGNGDGSRAFQTFELKQPPLTYVAAPNPSGVDSTLHVYVDDVEWHESDTLAGLAPTDRAFIARTDDADKTSVVFGNGRQGARAPTGAANVRAVYRNGIGSSGNVQARQISLLASRPLGVKEVINPLRASGGANREGRDQARKSAPLAVAALDRLVSLQDYADFARTFAGIAKASAQRLTDGRRELVHLTIAGVDDIPIDPPSDLYRNLVAALRLYGDPDQPVQVDLRELLLLVMSAKVYLQADYVWEPVVAKVRSRLLDAFSFDRRELGQDALLSEAIAVMQATPGVAYVDVDIFGAIPEKTADPETKTRRLLTPKEITEFVQTMLDPSYGQQPETSRSAPPPPAWLSQLPAGRQPLDRVIANLAGPEDGTLRPAQLAIFSSLVPDTLILNRG